MAGRLKKNGERRNPRFGNDGPAAQPEAAAKRGQCKFAPANAPLRQIRRSPLSRHFPAESTPKIAREFAPEIATIPGLWLE